MKMKILQIIKCFIGKILGFFPTLLPVGVSQFNEWAKSIIEIYKPAADVRSVRFALATMLLHLGPTEARKPKRYFALCLHKGAAAQVGAYMFTQIKTEQEDELKALKEASEREATLRLVPNEATTTPEAASNVIPIQNASV
jgi:hypothetical protein